MKSKKATNFLREIEFGDWSYTAHTVIQAVELAESEMREKAIEAFCANRIITEHICLRTPLRQLGCANYCQELKDFIQKFDEE